jgi:type II secretory pathway pseudopilin PulG
MGPEPAGEGGFMLLGLIVAIAIILMVMGVAASKVAFSLRREREEESARRANQYVRAIRLYYRKFKSYPTSIQQLDNTNKIRFLRQDYIDPLTGKNDWRIIAVGQNKTTVKGFFGEPLGGIASQGLGALAGSQSTGGGFPGGPGGATGQGGTVAGGGTGMSGTISGGGSGTGSFGTGGTTDTSGGAAGTGNGTNGQPGTTGGAGSPFGGGSSGPLMGVGSNASGPSIIVVNEQTSYQTWEFLYDPRIEQLVAAGQLNGGGVGTAGAGGRGQTPGGIVSQTGPPGFSGTQNQTGGGGQSGGTPTTQP